MSTGQVQERGGVQIFTRVGSVHRNSIGALRLIVDLIELRVIEDIENFPAEVDARAFADGKVLKQTGIEVQSSRIVQCVAPDIAKGQPRRQRESSGVINDRSADVREFCLWQTGVRIAD